VKHIQDHAQDLVTDALDGLAGLVPSVVVERASRGECPDQSGLPRLLMSMPDHPCRFLSFPTVVYRRASTHDPRVVIISGGGSGHEPAHAGFVGEGLLDAAVCGSIFASPNVKQIRRAFDLVVGEHG
jgi:hypothetical protein